MAYLVPDAVLDVLHVCRRPAVAGGAALRRRHTLPEPTDADACERHAHGLSVLEMSVGWFPRDSHIKLSGLVIRNTTMHEEATICERSI